MRTEIHSLWKEERGVSVVIGAMLMLLIMATLYGTIQAYYVPIWNNDVEYEHLNMVHDDMMTFKSDVEDVALSGEPKSSDFRMGVRYPNRIFLANPGPGVAGSLTSENVSVHIEYTIDGNDDIGEPTITQSYDSNRIIYEVQGTIDSPKLVYEHGLIIRDYGNEYATTDEQSLIIGDEIYLPVLTGNLTASSSMETESIALKPLSQSYSRTKIKSVTITIDTAYPKVWDQLLVGTGTADTTVQVDLDEGEIIITSTAVVEQISFPAGDVTADALYAGLATLSTRAVPVTYSSIDISQDDYPCIIDIDITAVSKGSSTITATVENATAPFDIHADLSNLMSNPEMYDVFPNSSSPESITATSWVQTQNTVSWNITHPEYVGGETIVISFWVCNTENNMQFFTTIVFNRKNTTSWY